MIGGTLESKERRQQAVYYINLDRREDRRSEIEHQLTTHSLFAERFSAVDAGKLPRHASPEILTLGETGCLRSHFGTFQNFINKKSDFALVLEDDAVLELEGSWSQPLKVLREAMREHKIGVLQLGYIRTPAKSILGKIYELGELVFRKKPTLGSRIFLNGLAVSLHTGRFLPGSHCYLITREAAKEVVELFDVSRPLLPLDGLFDYLARKPGNSLSFKIAYLSRPLSTQASRNGISAIDTDIG